MITRNNLQSTQYVGLPIWCLVISIVLLNVEKQDQKDLLNFPLYRAMYFYIVMPSLVG